MRQFMISAAAIAALLASVPANAQQVHGPNKVGNQCLTPAPGHTRDLGFGVWGTVRSPPRALLVHRRGARSVRSRSASSLLSNEAYRTGRQVILNSCRNA